MVSSRRGSGPQTLFQRDGDGTLTHVVGPYGHELEFTYDDRGRVVEALVPGGSRLRYEYDPASNLVRVQFPDQTTRRYHYEDTRHPHALTGITDENGDRYATYGYDAMGRAVSTSHGASNATRAFLMEYLP